MSILNKLVLYPSLVYGATMEYFGMRTWYTRIDEHCILGALPMERNYKQIIENEKIKAILTLNEDHELYYSIPKNEWTRHGINYLQVPIKDYIGVADLEQIKQSVDFIKKHKEKNECVYVHCKAGRYRSALIVACYLISTKNMKPEQAISFLVTLRPHVILNVKRQLNAMHSYYEFLNKKY
jgi:atypical dual specificity phosphatase